MTVPHRKVIARVEDEYGAVFEKAEVTFYTVATAPELSLQANLATGSYDIENSHAPIAYTAMYHVSEATRLAGKRMRPLMQEVDVVDENGVVIDTIFDDKFLVNQDAPEVIAARQGVADPVEIVLRSCGADVKCKFV